MSNSNFVVTRATTNPSGIVSLGSIVSPAPFFDPAGNLDMNGLDLIGTATTATNLTITDDNTNATFYPVFVSDNTGNLPLKVDKTTNPLSYNPSTGTMVAQSFSPGSGFSTFSALTTAGLEVLNATTGRTKILNNQITCATTATNPPTTTINPDSITCSSLNSASTTTITPTSFTAGSGSSSFSSIQNTGLQVVNAGSNTTTINSFQMTCSQVSPASTTTITPTTVTATTFVTDTAPAAGNQLGNKTYIDNFGGSGGWYFTSTVSVTAGTIFSFPNCLSNSYNAYEIYFIPSISSYSNTSGNFPDISFTFIGATSPVYQSYISDQSQGTSITAGYNTNAPRLIRSLDYTVALNRSATMKLDLWGTRNISLDPGSFRLTYVNEGFNSDNPGIKSWGRSTGTISFSTGVLTGIVLTYSNITNVTGSITIVVKAKY